jgi:RecB family exonuclease
MFGPRRRPLTVAALVAGLRERLVDPKSSETLRAAAAWRLARLAEASDADGMPLVRAAHPGGWWGIRSLTEAAAPVRDPAAPVRLSASQVATLKECALRWFLGHEASADEPATAAQGFGNVLHALADDVAKGDAPADLDVLMERLDQVWGRLAYDAPWQSAQERDEARAALERFLTWHVAERGRAFAVSEHGFDVTLRAGEYRIRVAGQIDRVETGEAGQVYLVDFKTGRTPETEQGASEHPQLAVYQLAAAAGALDDTDAAQAEPGGAELIYLRKGGKGGLPTVRGQLPLADAPQGPDWAERLLADVAARVLDERFDAYGEHDCDRCQFRSCCPKQPEGRPLVE